MAKYIKREELVAWLQRIPLKDLSDGRGLCRIIMVEDFERAIRTIPGVAIVDLAPVVRCKDCLFWERDIGFCHYHSRYYDGGASWDIFNEDDFCSYGERKEND